MFFISTCMTIRDFPRPTHKNFDFQQDLTTLESNYFQMNLEHNLKRDIAIALSFDWNLADSIGITHHLKSFFPRRISSIPFESKAWENLFEIEEVVYKELAI